MGTTSKSEDTKAGLLEAAEQILLEEGVHALSVRKIGTISGVNPALVTYHFGGLAGLLAELCEANLDQIQQGAEDIGATDPGQETLRDVLRTWLKPLQQAAVFTGEGRSLIVLNEVAASNAELRNNFVGVMLEISGRVQAAVRPFVPHLSQRELRARLRFISAATLGPPPRVKIHGAYVGPKALDRLDYLLAFAVCALGDAAIAENQEESAGQE